MLSTIAAQMDRLSKSIKVQQEIHAIHWDSKIKAKIANNIKRFQAKYTILSVELNAVQHENTLKSKDIYDRGHYVSMSGTEEETLINPGFSKVKNNRKPFETTVLEYETKAKNVDVSKMFGPEQLALTLLNKHFNEINNLSERDAISIVFYTMKQNFSALERVWNTRKNRLLRKQANRHKFA